MALLPRQTTSFNGVSPTFTAVSALDTFTNDGHTVIQVKNGGSGATTVTITSAQVCNQGFNHNITVSVPAGETRIIGPFQPNRFNDADGVVKVACSPTTSVTINVTQINY